MVIPNAGENWSKPVAAATVEEDKNITEIALEARNNKFAMGHTVTCEGVAYQFDQVSLCLGEYE